MLDKITFTGVDQPALGSPNNPFSALWGLCARYPSAEFGILIGSRTRETEEHGIFASLETIKAFRDAGAVRGSPTALHLCGAWSRAAVGEPSRISRDRVLALCEGFGRVQLNLHRGWFNGPLRQSRIDSVIRFIEAAPCASVILQHRTGWRRTPVVHDRVEYLFDRSGGKGREAFDAWPDPPEHGVRVGYAGGIGPHNIAGALAFAQQHAKAPLWFDMEGRIRTPDGDFDLDAVASVLSSAAFDAQPRARKPGLRP